jgi:hypothetical protein
LKAVEWDSPDRADDDPRAVKLMIDYLYLGDYDAGTPTVTDPIPPVTIEHAVEARQTLQPREDPWNFDTGSIAPPPQSEFNEDMWGAPPTKKKKGKKFRVPAAEPPPDISPLEMHAKMFATASKYEIKSLEQTACEKCKAEFDRDWSTADLIAAIDVVCNHTPDRKIELRNALKDAIARQALMVWRTNCFPGRRPLCASSKILRTSLRLRYVERCQFLIWWHFVASVYD